MDQIGFTAGDANLYRYCANRPTNGVDPSGLEEKPLGPGAMPEPRTSYYIVLGKPGGPESLPTPQQVMPGVKPANGWRPLRLDNGAVVWYPPGYEPAFLPNGVTWHPMPGVTVRRL